MEKKEFIAIVLDLKNETFIVYFISLISPLFDINIHPSFIPQVVGLIAKKPSIKVSAKYVDFENVFSSDLAFQLSQLTGINKYAIKLIKNQQSLYGAIYSL